MRRAICVFAFSFLEIVSALIAVFKPILLSNALLQYIVFMLCMLPIRKNVKSRYCERMNVMYHQIVRDEEHIHRVL